ncbi:MAG TPA: 50S ribosomal protein L24 [Myxococcaceae bacterium]|nr:50S ribosomal protein L24 [Myxococcaceae bacterium]
MQKLKVGDTVQVMAGQERSASTNDAKRGKVLRIDREKNRAAVEGLRVIKRSLKRTQQNPEGGEIEKPLTIAVPSLAVVCGKCDKPTRVGIRVEGEKKKRFCKQCDATID